MPAPADEQTLRNIVEAAPDGILVVDADGRIRIVNAQVERLFGYARDELIGELVEALVPGEDSHTAHARHRAAYDQHPATRPMGASLDLRGLRKDGSELPVEISLSPMPGPDGLLVIAIVRDVTAQKESEAERQQLLGAVEAQLVRDAVARDLHDEIIQAVYAVGLHLQAAATQDELSKNQALERARLELSAVIADLRSYIIQHLTDGRHRGHDPAAGDPPADAPRPAPRAPDVVGRDRARRPPDRRPRSRSVPARARADLERRAPRRGRPRLLLAAGRGPGDRARGSRLRPRLRASQRP